MQSILEDIPSILIYVDDIVVFGDDRATHDQTVRQVLAKLSAAGVRLNAAKCVFGSPTIDFLGHVWSASGIAPSPTKLEAIKTMPLPPDSANLRSFLGLAAYMGNNSVAHFSTLTEARLHKKFLLPSPYCLVQGCPTCGPLPT